MVLVYRKTEDGMCLGVPMKIVEVKGDSALCEFSGSKREVSLKLLPEAKVGDYVIVHAGFAIQKLDEKDALETLKMLQEAGII